ncbi:Esterase family protein OS=Streptomyces rimosus subsp. rimosus (strain ATCC / DSM 40260 / JCM 4667 / NRRL 2234) OX=1265868 GN=SRIM_020530 PE=4 SV=1 [Streptomyces rimosus subsp. rimosus]
MLCSLALAVNSSFAFYSSWDELLGNTDDAPVAVGKGGVGPQYADAGSLRGGLVQPAGPQGLDRVNGLPMGAPEKVGKVESVRIVGHRIRVVNPAFVYLPPQYFQPQYRRQRFPLRRHQRLPGRHHVDLAQHLRIPQTAGELIGEGRMQPTAPW